MFYPGFNLCFQKRSAPDFGIWFVRAGCARLLRFSPVTHEDAVEDVLEDTARLELLHDDAPSAALRTDPLDVRVILWEGVACVNNVSWEAIF